MNFEIPAGLTDLLQDFTVAVLKERPPDLKQFAADYFARLNDQKNEDEKPRGVRFAGSNAEPMQTEDDEDSDEPMGKDLTFFSIYDILVTWLACLNGICVVVFFCMYIYKNLMFG